MSLLSSLSLFLGSTVTIVGVLIAVYKISKRLEGAIGTDAKGRTISERLDRVEHQLWENGGTSLADRVNKIEACSIETSTEVKFIKDLIVTNMAVPVVQDIPRKRKSSSKPA
jgi:hypothetical protein